MDPKYIKAIEGITELLLSFNVAVPIVFSTVGAVVAIIRGVTGSGPTLSQIAELIKQKTERNDNNGRAEIDRLLALMGQQ